ncbi:MAG: hypothetical protein DRM97_06610 [Thermoprotei archaeon]|nr:MAG: hypothetical protein DRM97_06610 [Thermoprotei archaeon]
MKRHTSGRLKSFIMKRLDYLLLLLVIAYGILSVKTFFREGIPPGWDHPFHLVNSYLTARYFLPSLNILGWDPYNMFGWVFNQYYNPGAYLLVASIQVLSRGLIDIVTAYKIGLVIVYLLPALSIFALVKSMSSDGLAASIAALYMLTVLPEESEWLDAGLRQLYEIGMWPHRLGLGLAILALALFEMAIKARSRLIGITLSVWCGAIAAWCLLSHVMGALSLAFTMITFFAMHLLRELAKGRKDLSKALRSCTWLTALLLLAGVMALLFDSFWIIPLLETLKEYHYLPTVTWEVGPMMYLHVIYSLGMMNWIMLPIAAITPLTRAGKETKWPAIAAVTSGLIMAFISMISPRDGYLGLRLLYAYVMCFIVYLCTNDDAVYPLLASAFLLLFLSTGPKTYSFKFLWWKVDIGALLPYYKEYGYAKFGALARAFLMSACAIGFSEAMRLLARLTRRGGATRQLGAIGLMTLAFLLVNTHLSAQVENTDLDYPLSRDIVFKMDKDYPGYSKFMAVIEWIRENASLNTYIFVEDTTYKIGEWMGFTYSHYFYLISYMTGKPIVGGIVDTRYITHPLMNTETEIIFGQHIYRLRRRPELLSRIAKELGITYFIVFYAPLKDLLKSLPDFEEIYRVEEFSIFKAIKFNPIIELTCNGTVKILEYVPNRIKIRAVAEDDGWLIIRMVNYPGWTCYVNGKETTIENHYPDIPSVVMVPGAREMLYNYKVPFMKVKVRKGVNDISLVFRRVTIGNTVTCLALIMLLAITLSCCLHALWHRRREYKDGACSKVSPGGGSSPPR